MERKIRQMVQGIPAVDGAGVHLTRVLGNTTVKAFDPFLMLDSFDSTNPADYVAGFPMHPHRGIETISYLDRGRMQHRDTLGFEDTIRDGDVQWMVAGSGIEHEERIPAADQMRGIQLWLNLPAKEKMAKPSYRAIHKNEILELPVADGKGVLRLVAGEYEGHKGYESKHIPLTFYALHLKEGAKLELKSDPEQTAVLFTLCGSVSVSGDVMPEKTAAVLEEGDHIALDAAGEAEVLVLMAKPLHESVVWGGPVVMNTREELYQAFEEINKGTFLKEQMEHEV